MCIRDREYCATLKKAGIRIQAFEVNQRTLKCTGNCGSCPAMKSAAMSAEEEDAELGYRKLGRGCSDNLLNEPGEERLFTIFVKKMCIRDRMLVGKFYARIKICLHESANGARERCNFHFSCSYVDWFA